MFTEQVLLKAKIDLFNISANHAMEAYTKANYNMNGKRKSKKHIPYSLDDDGEKARQMYHLVYGKNSEDITPDQEELIKGYLLIYRTHRTEYIEDLGGQNYYSSRTM